ncbi:hypothetical protein Bbelb_128920 [Branchiostoma belcheri]|nr:hypothetical protein Bbelb_128920 [Branchiostoma belcheri]
MFAAFLKYDHVTESSSAPRVGGQDQEVNDLRGPASFTDIHDYLALTWPRVVYWAELGTVQNVGTVKRRGSLCEKTSMSNPCSQPGEIRLTCCRDMVHKFTQLTKRAKTVYANTTYSPSRGGQTHGTSPVFVPALPRHHSTGAREGMGKYTRHRLAHTRQRFIANIISIRKDNDPLVNQKATLMPALHVPALCPSQVRPRRFGSSAYVTGHVTYRACGAKDEILQWAGLSVTTPTYNVCVLGSGAVDFAKASQVQPLVSRDMGRKPQSVQMTGRLGTRDVSNGVVLVFQCFCNAVGVADWVFSGQAYPPYTLKVESLAGICSELKAETGTQTDNTPRRLKRDCTMGGRAVKAIFVHTGSKHLDKIFPIQFHLQNRSDVRIASQCKKSLWSEQERVCGNRLVSLRDSSRVVNFMQRHTYLTGRVGEDEWSVSLRGAATSDRCQQSGSTVYTAPKSRDPRGACGKCQGVNLAYREGCWPEKGRVLGRIYSPSRG